MQNPQDQNPKHLPTTAKQFDGDLGRLEDIAIQFHRPLPPFAIEAQYVRQLKQGLWLGVLFVALSWTRKEACLLVDGKPQALVQRTPSFFV